MLTYWYTGNVFLRTEIDDDMGNLLKTMGFAIYEHKDIINGFFDISNVEFEQGKFCRARLYVNSGIDDIDKMVKIIRNTLQKQKGIVNVCFDKCDIVQISKQSEPKEKNYG